MRDGEIHGQRPCHRIFSLSLLDVEDVETRCLLLPLLLPFSHYIWDFTHQVWSLLTMRHDSNFFNFHDRIHFECPRILFFALMR